MSNLNPRDLPLTYPEMLQKIIEMQEKLEKYDGTHEQRMSYALMPAVVLAKEQLKAIESNAIRRMFGT